MEFLLLGPVEVRDDGRSVPLPRRQQRALLAALLLRAGEVVSTDRLVDELWGENPPASAVGSLQNAVSQLRKTLGPELVRTQPPGYVLAVEHDAVDARRFEGLLAESAGLEPAARAATLREALALWRGPALADLADEPWAETEAARLEELRLTAVEEHLGAELELGRHAQLVAQLEALVAEHPLRERLWRQLALALYRSGRQAEALEACRSATTALDELGLEPSAALRQLERDILQQSATLAGPAVVVDEEEVPAEAAGERRVVSVLAASVPEDEDPDALRAALARVLEAANAAVARHGGELERFGPEGLVAVFGADTSREDDALRAVRAGVELAVAAGVAVGVATGDAVLADEPRVAGAAVARAAGLARSGEGVLLDPRTYELVREAVTAETAGPLARVLAVEATRPEGRLDAPLVGRQAELELLRSAFADAVEERRCVAATVTGEPGIGKTRLARELTGSLAATVLIGRCAAYGEGATFLPVVEALHGIDPAVADDELVARRIAGLAGAAQEPGSLGESYWAVRRVLEALAHELPVALLLDDVHWAEPALLDLVEYLRDRVTGAPLLVLCLARPELLDERPGWAAGALRLEPLTEEETRVLVGDVAPLEDDARERIVELAEGNPLYAQQLAAYSAESGKALEPDAMPATIDAVLAGRLGRLEAGERATLQRAAVVGREFSRGAVAALAPPDLAVDAHLLALTRRGFVRALSDPLPGDDAYRFHHVLLRDAAYATLTKEQRADLHERVAAWLDRDGPGDDALAGFHLEQAALRRQEVGSEHLELAVAASARLGDAGMRAWNSGDIHAGVGLLRRATSLGPASSRRAELLFELGVALRLHGQPTEAIDVLERARAEAQAVGDRRIELRTAVEHALRRLLVGEGSPHELLETTEHAIPLLEAAGDERGLGRAWLAVGSVHNFLCQNEAIIEAARRGVVHYRRAGFSHARPLAAEAHALYHGPTPMAEAIGRCAELLEEASDRGAEADVLIATAGLRALAGQFEDARRTCDDARATLNDLGMTRTIVTTCDQISMEIERLRGDLPTAEGIGRSSLEALTALGEESFAATRAAHLAEVLLEAEDVSQAAGFVEIARTHASEHDVLTQFLWRSSKARLLARQGKSTLAGRMASQAALMASNTDALADRARTQIALADVLMLLGRSAEALNAVTQAEDLYRRKGGTAGVASVRRLFGQLLPA